MRFWRRKEVVAPPASARAERDVWLEWLRLSGLAERTIYGYQRTTDRFLEQVGEIAFGDVDDEMLQGFIEEAKPASRQQRRSPFANWLAWGYRTKRIPHNPMHHVPAYKIPPRPEIEVFTDEECLRLTSLPEPDGTLLALLLGTGLRKQEASKLTVKRVDLKQAFSMLLKVRRAVTRESFRCPWGSLLDLIVTSRPASSRVTITSGRSGPAEAASSSTTGRLRARASTRGSATACSAPRCPTGSRTARVIGTRLSGAGADS